MKDWKLDFEEIFDEKKTDKEEAKELKILKSEWIKERFSPVLLKPRINISKLLEIIEKREMDVLDKNLSSDIQENQIYELEIERIKYILCSYIKLRLYKIEQYAEFISNNEEEEEKLTKQERDYLKRYSAIELKLFNSVVTEGDDLNVDDIMKTPNEKHFVLCKCLKEVEVLDDEEETLLLEKDNIYVIRFVAIKKYVENGSVILI